MTAGIPFFDSPLFLGFDQYERTLDRIKKTAQEGYPPYNIEQTGPNTLRITLAVAGFSMQDMDIEVEQNQLTVRGKQQEDSERVYLYRGIAGRPFQKGFVLAEGIKVLGAALDNGLLHIDMEKVQPERNARKIEISSSPSMTLTSSPKGRLDDEGLSDLSPPFESS